jgi:hypothetical protein
MTDNWVTYRVVQNCTVGDPNIEREERMFNLIVSTGVQSDDSGTIFAARVFEYTEDTLKNRFMPNGRLNVSDVMSFPTIFMQEGFDDEVAGVGWLSRIELQGKDYQLHLP